MLVRKEVLIQNLNFSTQNIINFLIVYIEEIKSQMDLKAQIND